jgi:hypothetical protein
MDRDATFDAGRHVVAPRGARTPAAPGRGRLAWLLAGELVLMGGVFLAYRQIRFLTRNDTDAAMANARRVVDVERFFHVFNEQAVQDLVLRAEPLVHFLNRYYVMVHFPLTVAFLLWVFWRHHEAYRRIRYWFVSVTVAALAIHVAFPLAPPRMLAGEGFVDTLQVYGPRIYSTDTSESIANQFAAMPSLHFGWAAIVAGAYVGLRRTRRSMWAMLHPAITLLAIVATANHYWLDAAVAFVLVAVVALVVAGRARRAATEAPSVRSLVLVPGERPLPEHASHAEPEAVPAVAALPALDRLDDPDAELERLLLEPAS